ncbi:MAG: FAD-binding oxidoreductase, partial [Aigarchaeota archaeon]|nr:FAD-binding oxidoreductase [Aigarchaeota archaeon]
MGSSEIKTEKPTSLKPESSVHHKMDPSALENYLRDEAGAVVGKAEALFLPEDELQVSMVLREAAAKNIQVTVSGAGTGLTGARVPLAGWVLSTENLTSALPNEGLKEILYKNKETGTLYQILFGEDPKTTEPFAVAPAGISIGDLQEALRSHGHMYPPDPTEATALLGATVATNASGARTFRFGPTRRWIRRIRVVLPNGEVLN